VHLAALDQHSGGSKPYQRENRQRGRPVRSLAVTWGRGPALGRRVVAVDAEAKRFYGQVSILVDERGTLQNSNFQFSFGKLLGFGDITMA
jgi:hypothetical protein